MRIRGTLAPLAMTAMVLAVTAAPGGGTSGPVGRRGLPAAGSCGALSEIRLPSGAVACSHGADPAPAGVDIDEPFDPGKARTGLILPETPSQTSSAAAGTGKTNCYGDGQSGNRVRAVYARPSNRPDRYAAVVSSIRTFADETDAVFSVSAGRFGGDRHIRFVTDSKCQLVIDNVVLSPAGDDNLDNTIAELAQRGYDDPTRKYLVWMDSTVLCGIAAYYIDDTAGSTNFNNGNAAAPGVVARIDSGCWGLANRGESIEAHELMHSLGSVLPSAPNSTPAGHCEDDADRMCYKDGTHVNFQEGTCPGNTEALFDCNGDDYFNPNPPAGSYLATRWNTARSSFLTSTAGTSVLAVTDARTIERDSGTRDAVFTVTLAAPTGSGVSVRYYTFNGTARADDFDAVSGIVSFEPGTTAKEVRVPIRGDTDDEADETFFLILHSPSGAPLGDPQGAGVIADDDPKRLGYRFVATDGGIFAFGEAPFYGSTGDITLFKPINGMAITASGNGYWMVASDGGIFAFGDAPFHGSAGGQTLASPVVGMAPTASGGGYWLATAGGEVFNYGDAGGFGGLTSPSPSPIVGIAPSAGGGYWLVSADGQVFPFGSAATFEAIPVPPRPIVSVTSTPTGRGYWLVTNAGDVYSVGDAGAYGSTSNLALAKPVVGMAPTPTGEGYWLVATDGGIFAFGDATFLGSTGNIVLNKPVVGMTAVR